MAAEDVNVSVADDHLDGFPDVVERMKKVGLKVHQQMEAVGVVSGSIDPAKLADLERVEGVAAVEPSRSFQLPPPESDVQ